MSTVQTWERRAIRGLLQFMDIEDCEMIPGITVEPDGSLRFAEERMEGDEISRMVEGCQALRTLLEERFAALDAPTPRTSIGGVAGDTGPGGREASRVDLERLRVEGSADDRGEEGLTL